jgi:dTDP-glucose 4,6-dehydratase
MPGSSGRPLPAADLDHVLEHTAGLWDEFRGARLLVTGGTGFFGRWMLETFVVANDELSLGAEAIVLTRDPGRFEAGAPHVARHRAVTALAGDVRTFDFPETPCSHVLHLATESGRGWSPAASFRTAVDGTQRVLAFAAQQGVRKLLFTSSGAVYGTQPPHCERLTEEYTGAPHPDDPAAGYALGKRAAENLCSVAAMETGLQAKIARCFAFVGPLLPLDANFAIGNFIRDALFRDAIQVNGDGTARRSYLYAADLAVWLWTILNRGESGRPYNVGSDDDLSIADLAHKVASVVRPGIPVRIGAVPGPGTPPGRYVPSIARAAGELGLRARITLDDAIERTAEWYSQ